MATQETRVVALSDTHRQDGLPLTESLAAAIADADLVVHAGDFTTAAVLEDLDSRAEDLLAVHGNSDSGDVRERLPAVATRDLPGGERVLAVHGHEHDRTSLPLLARQEGADLVVVGHTHRPGVETAGPTTTLNPGSHVDPRGGPATFAEWHSTGGGQVRRVDGTVIQSCDG